MPYLQLLRPHQWVKNLFVFAGLVFGKKLLDPEAVGLSLLGFGCLCLVSSTVYILNDIHDRAEDRLHPRKRHRPIASGAVSVPQGAALGVVLLLTGLAGSYALGLGFFLCVVLYLVIQALYTHLLKHMVILDVIAIATGFVLRAVAGAVLVHVVISPWLVVCTFTLCLFMGFSKRRCELTVMGNDGRAPDQHRRTLAAYSPDLLNQMTTMTAGVAVVGFMLYATDERTISPVHGFGTNLLVYTLPLVVYAVFRFAYLTERGDVDGPTDVMLRDRPFQAALVLWALIAMLIVYKGHDFELWLKSQRAPQPPVTTRTAAE